MDKKSWEVLILETDKRYKLSSMNFVQGFIEIYADEDIRKQYGYNEVRVFHGDRELNMKRGEKV